jgi:hypothetical protein
MGSVLLHGISLGFSSLPDASRRLLFSSLLPHRRAPPGLPDPCPGAPAPVGSATRPTTAWAAAPVAAPPTPRATRAAAPDAARSSDLRCRRTRATRPAPPLSRPRQAATGDSHARSPVAPDLPPCSVAATQPTAARWAPQPPAWQLPAPPSNPRREPSARRAPASPRPDPSVCPDRAPARCSSSE